MPVFDPMGFINIVIVPEISSSASLKLASRLKIKNIRTKITTKPIDTLRRGYAKE